MRLILAMAFLISSAAMQAQIKLEVAADGRSIIMTSAKQVEVLEVQVDEPDRYAVWQVALDRPALQAGERTRVYLARPSNCAHVVSAVFSDFSEFGSSDAAQVMRVRDQIAAGGPVDVIEGDNAAPVIYLLNQYRRKHPGSPSPQATGGHGSPGYSQPPPYPWWTANSMTLSLIMNGELETNTPDACGNPQSAAGCADSCAAYVTAKAGCVVPPGKRPFITASGAGGIDCPGGTITVYSGTLYGPGGQGGSCSQRFAITTYAEFSSDGVETQGSVTDSCGFTQPVQSGAFGAPCNDVAPQQQP